MTVNNRRPDRHLWFVGVGVGNLRPLLLRPSEPRTKSDRLSFSFFSSFSSFFLSVCQLRWRYFKIEAKRLISLRCPLIWTLKKKYIDMKTEGNNTTKMNLMTISKHQNPNQTKISFSLWYFVIFLRICDFQYR